MTAEQKAEIARDRVTVLLLDLLFDTDHGHAEKNEVYSRFSEIAKVAVPLIQKGTIRVPSSWSWRGAPEPKKRVTKARKKK